ncbi:hypothetical protein ACFFLM_16385 [Deinococcus oregonensis]|uniref:Uncharacterized protein n=1 Tax=Deinococcus oregonensis TaxID=1805970 RepID=A0ABV6B3L0_9DEIO
MRTPAKAPFEFDLQQRNTLNVSGLAAYVQRPPPDHVGWVHVMQVWLPGWRPAKWAYQVQHRDVTFESYCVVEDYEAQQLDFEPLEVLIITAYQAFLSDDIREVERFFAEFTDNPEFVRHPDKVRCPPEYANEEQPEELPACWSLIRRRWAALLLCLRDSGNEVVWDCPGKQLRGNVTQVAWNSFEISTAEEAVTLSFSQRFGVRLYRVSEDGYVQMLWHEPTSRTSLDPSTLPIWSYSLSQWVNPVQDPEDE